MNNKKSTKRTLLTSVLSLILCMAMLIGTTFAWFTDEVTSKGNIIKSGKLDVEMHWAEGKEDPATANWKDASEGAIFKSELWEPGYTEVRHIKIVNEGTLDFKYQLNIVANGEVSDLADVIDVYYIDPAIQVTDRVQLTDANKIGTLTQVLANISTTGSGNLLAGENHTITLALKMQESAGNEYQDMSIGSDFAIQLLATQLTSEFDSFNNQYDALASVTVGTTAELIEAINNATGNTIVYLKSGEYAVSSVLQVNKGQAVTLYGIGDVTFKNTGTSHIFNVANESTVTFQNLNFDGNYDENTKSRNGIFVRGNSNVTLVNTNIKNTGHYDICIDQVSDKEYSIGKTATVTLYDSDVEDVSSCAFPVTNHAYSDIEGNSYVKFVYDNESSVGSFQKDSFAAAENIYVNGDNGATGTMVASGVWKIADKTYAVRSKEGLINLESVLASAKPSEANILTVELMCDVDLAGVKWDTLDCMWIVFNGNTHTISNINCGKDNYVGRSGFWGYAGAVTVNNLTLENVTSCGTQAGTFAGSADGLKLNNCYLKGINTVAWEQNAADAPYQETASGIGAITGVTINSIMNVEIVENATVTLAMNDMPTVLHRVDNLVGHKVADYSVNSGNIVTNGTVTCLGVYYISVSSADELKAAVDAGATNLLLADGEYDVYGCGGKTLTISGSKDAIIKLYNDGEDGCDYAFGSAGTGVGNYTFNGVTFDTTKNTGNYKGFAYMKGTFNDCNFVGAYSLNNANDFVFNKCTFDFKNGYFWTWGANSVTFDGCTFNGNSKTILAHGSASTVININNCNFAATEAGYTGAGDHTAVVEMDPTGTNTYTINFTGNNTITDNYAGWTRVKDGSTGHIINGLN